MKISKEDETWVAIWLDNLMPAGRNYGRDLLVERAILGGYDDIPEIIKECIISIALCDLINDELQLQAKKATLATYGNKMITQLLSIVKIINHRGPAAQNQMNLNVRKWCKERKYVIPEKKS